MPLSVHCAGTSVVIVALPSSAELVIQRSQILIAYIIVALGLPLCGKVLLLATDKKWALLLLLQRLLFIFRQQVFPVHLGPSLPKR